MATRSISLLVIVVAVAIVLAAGILAYTSTVHRAGSQPSQVTWRDQNGNPITSITLISSDLALRSKTVSFSCNPSVGSVILQLSPTIPSQSVSLSSFPSCTQTPNSFALTVLDGSSVSGTSTIPVVDSHLYQNLSGQLTITVRVS